MGEFRGVQLPRPVADPQQARPRRVGQGRRGGPGGEHRPAVAEDVVQPDADAVHRDRRLGHQRTHRRPRCGPAATHQPARAERRRAAGQREVRHPRQPPHRAQDDPPDGGGTPATAGHQPAEQDGDADQRPGVRRPLSLVGVQQPVVRAGQHGGELPAELVDVAQPQPEALADERRGEVGGVAAQQHPARAPPVGDLRGVAVLGGADHLGTGHTEGDQQRREVDVGRALAVGQPELDPVPVTGDRHGGGRAAGVADLLDAGPAPQRPVGHQVDDQPALGRPEVAHLGADQPAHGAVRPVAAQHRVGRQLLDVPGRPVPDGQPDRSVPLSLGALRSAAVLDVHHLHPAAQRGAGLGGQRPAEQPLQVGLGEHRALRPAVLPRAAAELDQHPAVAVHQPQTRHRAADRGEVVGDAGGLQHPQALVVQVHRPGLRVDVDVPVEHQDVDAPAGQQQGRGHADRAGAHDHHRHGGECARGGGVRCRDPAPAVRPAARAGGSCRSPSWAARRSARHCAGTCRRPSAPCSAR
jgi:hypothetical protein